MIPMIFSEVRVTAVADTPVLLLRETRGDRYLPIWISAVGANAVLSALEDAPDEHPTTHDLLVDALAAVDTVVEEVRIVDVVDGVYTASLLINGTAVACRASDGIAVALRCGAGILVAESVLDRVGAAPQLEDPGAVLGGGSDEQLEQFRAFLDTISPEDFEADGPGEPGEPQP